MGTIDSKAEQTILTLVVEEHKAETLSAWITGLWNVPVVQLSKPNFDRVWLDLYFASPVEAAIAEKVFRGKKDVLGTGLRTVTPQKWQTFWKHHFKRMDVGSRLRICPVWEKTKRTSRGRKVIRLDPGLSFGTGDHFTTRFCLETLDRLTQKQKIRSMIDVGTGSGVIAIAAAKLGCAKIWGVDNDPQSIVHAKQNAVLNNLKGAIQLRVLDVVQAPLAEKFDVVCANLYALLLMEIAPKLVRCAKRWIVLSGIRELEADSVADVYSQLGVYEVARDGDGEWAGLLFEKRK